MSEIFPWLRETICDESQAAPAYLSCSELNVPVAVVPSPAPPPSLSPGLLTFYIRTDFTPEDTGWELRTVPNNKIVASRPMGYYQQQQAEIFEKEMVEPGFYRLVIYDRDRDGFQGIMAVYKGQSTAKADLLVFEPGFSSKSKDSVSHGFYVGDKPPNILTLDVKFDSNPTQFAWIITNKEDNLQLGFRWFLFYTKPYESIRETIPIYGSERGLQEYELSIYDNNGDGLCCANGMGSYALYLGESANVSNQIISGGKYESNESCVFQINASGELVSSSNAPPNPNVGTLTFGPGPTPTMVANPVPQNNIFGGSGDVPLPTGNAGNSDTSTTISNTVDPSSAMSQNGSVLVGPGFSYLTFTTFAVLLLFR